MKTASATDLPEDSRKLRLLTLYEAVEAIGRKAISVKTLRRAVQSGELPHRRLTPSRNAKILIPLPALEEWVRGRRDR